jgi:hypothetical protein
MKTTAILQSIVLLLSSGAVAACAQSVAQTQPAVAHAASTPVAAVVREAETERKPGTGLMLQIVARADNSELVRAQLTVTALADVGASVLTASVLGGAVIADADRWPLSPMRAGEQLTQQVTVRRTTADATHGAQLIATIRMERPGEVVSESAGEWVFGSPDRRYVTSINAHSPVEGPLARSVTAVGTERLIRTPEGLTLHDTVIH